MHRFWLIAITILASLALANASAAELLPRSVLIFDQSEPNSPWGIRFRDALRSTLGAEPTAPVVIYSEVLDFTRLHTNEYEELLRTFFRAKYRDKPIGVIVAHGSFALEILMRLRAELWSTVPVVFGAVDEPTVARLNLPPDVTGTTLMLRLGNSINAARALVPNLSRVALVGDPFERQAFRRHYAQELPQIAKELEIIDLLGLPMAKIKERVAVLPSDSAIIYTSIYVDGAGTTFIPRDALVHVAQAANRPIVGEVETLIGYGVTGGFVAIPEPIAEASARAALRILTGEKAFDIPITAGNFNKPMFDWRQLQRWNISESQLPPGSEIRFRNLTLWEQYWWELNAVFAAILLQSVMIGWLLIERRRRHFAELESRSRLREVIHLDRVAAAGEMSASIAHEINQPLTAIVLSGNVALRWLKHATPDLEQVSIALNRIISDGHRAGQVIATVRAMFKKETQQTAPVDLNEIIREVLALLHFELEENDVLVTTVLTDGLPRVPADRTQLQQVILNLVKNAIDAMSSIHDRARALRIRSEWNEDGDIIVLISDSGTGIERANLDRIFEPFFTTKVNGMGMGLSICRSIIEDHGGRLSVAPGSSHGSVFEIVLPQPRQGAVA